MAGGYVCEGDHPEWGPISADISARSRLISPQEDTFVEETYPEWDREAARERLLGALGARVLADGDRSKCV